MDRRQSVWLPGRVERNRLRVGRDGTQVCCTASPPRSPRKDQQHASHSWSFKCSASFLSSSTSRGAPKESAQRPRAIRCYKQLRMPRSLSMSTLSRELEARLSFCLGLGPSKATDRCEAAGPRACPVSSCHCRRGRTSRSAHGSSPSRSHTSILISFLIDTPPPKKKDLPQAQRATASP